MGEAHMKRAVALSVRGVELGRGGPFGAAVVHGGAVVGEGWNEVLRSNDPATHAEVVAIRHACRKLETHDLTDCAVDASCEACPLCLGAVCWSRTGSVYFSVNRRDAAGIEFRDELIREELAKPFDERALPMAHVPCDGGSTPSPPGRGGRGVPSTEPRRLGPCPVDGRQPLRRTGAAHVVRNDAPCPPSTPRRGIGARDG